MKRSKPENRRSSHVRGEDCSGRFKAIQRNESQQQQRVREKRKKQEEERRKMGVCSVRENPKLN